MRPKYRYTSRKGGLLADEMGLGKTVQVAAFLSAVLGKSATSEDKRRTFPLPEGAMPDQMNFKPYSVEMTVEWGDANSPRSFSLSTLRLVSNSQGIGMGPGFPR